ncbi:MAG: serine/threonine protein kinase [Myxococcales bacterium]|nr:serine/threonine protein kinase [Myxococcales bacterium]
MTSVRDPFQIVGQTVDDAVVIDAMVGEGGFGVVYRGHHTKLREPVAVKVLKLPTSLDAGQRESFLKKFQLEARILYRLSQETLSVVRAIGFGSLETRDGWAPYCLLEWLEGESLDHLLAARRARIAKGELEAGRPLRELVPLVDPLMEAVDKAHGIGVIHRDIKPANIFVSGDVSSPTVKLLDFGIAKLVDLSSDLAGTATLSSGTLMALTPEYAAPEQWDRELGAPSARTDIYALALLLLELMLDRHPHEGASASQRMFSACNPAKRPTPRRLGLSVSDAVERCFARALAVEPAERPASASAFWRELREAALGDSAPSTLRAGVAAVATAETAGAADTIDATGVADAGAAGGALGDTLPVPATGVDEGRVVPRVNADASQKLALAPTALSQPRAEQAERARAAHDDEDEDADDAAAATVESHAVAVSPGVAPPRAGQRRRMLLLSSIAMVLVAAIGVTFVALPMRSSEGPEPISSGSSAGAASSSDDTPKPPPPHLSRRREKKPGSKTTTTIANVDVKRSAENRQVPGGGEDVAGAGSGSGSARYIAGRLGKRGQDNARARALAQRLQGCLKARGRYDVRLVLSGVKVKHVKVKRLAGPELSRAERACLLARARSTPVVTAESGRLATKHVQTLQLGLQQRAASRAPRAPRASPAPRATPTLPGQPNAPQRAQPPPAQPSPPQPAPKTKAD